LNLNIQSHGYVVVKYFLTINTRTRVGFPFHSHTIGDMKKVVYRDNKQHFGLLE
jgi:hypothetical protein